MCKLYPDDTQEDCIPNQLMRRPSNSCQYASLVYPDPFVEQIDSRHILTITNNFIEVEEICENIHIRKLTGPTEIILDESCKIIINKETYTAQQDQFLGSSILLPPLEIDEPNSTRLKLSSIKLDEIHQIHDAINKMTPVEIKPFEESQTAYWPWILLSILLIICFSAIFIWTKCRGRTTPSINILYKKNQGPPQEEEANQTSDEVPPRLPF